MRVQNILILDDISSLSDILSKKLKTEYANGLTIKRFTGEKEFKVQLDGSNQGDTLLMVNATFKSHAEAYRYRLEGLRRIVKLGLRITWLRLHPVIVYGTIPEEEMLGATHGGIFALKRSHKYHKYLSLTRIKYMGLKPLIDTVLPIPNEKELREVINESCISKLREFVGGLDHDTLSKTYKLDSESGRKEFSDSLIHLQKILYEDCIDKSLLSDTIKLLENFVPVALPTIKKNVKSVRNRLNLLIEKLKQEESVNAAS